MTGSHTAATDPDPCGVAARRHGDAQQAPAAADPVALHANRAGIELLAFRGRDSRQLFFPTVHVHDGLVHHEADFDHELYFQMNHLVAAVSMPGEVIEAHPSSRKSLKRFIEQRFEKARGPLERYMNMERPAGTSIARRWTCAHNGFIN